LKILDIRHFRDLIRTPDFSGLPALEKLILEDCIRLVQIHESIGDLQRLLILNELPEEMSRLNSLQELVLDGCSNLNSLNMELEHHQGRKLLQSDGIVGSTSFITSLPLKLFFPSRFSTRRMLRFTSFSLPRSLESLDLSGTPIHFLPESINDLGLLRHLYLRNCNMLQALPELPSHLDSLDVSSCYSLQKLVNPDHLVKFQDRIKQELIQKFDSHMFRTIETVSAQIQPSRFQVLPHPFYCFGNLHLNTFLLLILYIDIVLVVHITFTDGIFNVVVSVFDEDEMLRWFHEEEEEDKWLIQNEYVDNFSFKISSPPPAHRICGFNLLISCVMSAYRGFSNVFIEIRNNTSGRSLLCKAFVFFMRYERGVREIQSLLHTKLRGNDPIFDNGDDVSISVRPHGPAIQIRTVGVQWLHEEGGKDEVINAHNSSDDDDDDDDVAEVEIASHIVRNYNCSFHAKHRFRNFTVWNFAKKGLEPVFF